MSFNRVLASTIFSILQTSILPGNMLSGLLTGVFSLGTPRQIEFGLSITF
jgi:hypothetical protein